MRFPSLFGTPVAEYLFPALVWLLALAFLLLASGFSPVSREVPILVSWLTLLLSSVDLFSRMRVPAAQTMARWLNPGVRPKEAAGKPGSTARLLMAIGGVTGFVAALVLVGVLYAVPAFLFVALYWGGRCRLAVSVLIAVLVTGLIWSLFAGLLQLELFPGLLFGGDW
jgi:hypothetical protein